MITAVVSLCGLLGLLGLRAVIDATGAADLVSPRYPLRPPHPSTTGQPAPSASAQPRLAIAPAPAPAGSAGHGGVPAVAAPGESARHPSAHPPPNTDLVRTNAVLFRQSLIWTGAIALAVAAIGIAIVGWRRRQW
jgi:hypothetical protein